MWSAAALPLLLVSIALLISARTARSKTPPQSHCTLQTQHLHCADYASRSPQISSPPEAVPCEPVPSPPAPSADQGSRAKIMSALGFPPTCRHTNPHPPVSLRPQSGTTPHNFAAKRRTTASPHDLPPAASLSPHPGLPDAPQIAQKTTAIPASAAANGKPPKSSIRTAPAPSSRSSRQSPTHRCVPKMPLARCPAHRGTRSSPQPLAGENLAASLPPRALTVHTPSDLESESGISCETPQSADQMDRLHIPSHRAEKPAASRSQTPGSESKRDSSPAHAANESAQE
jgi:hypothetical protein